MVDKKERDGPFLSSLFPLTHQSRILWRWDIEMGREEKWKEIGKGQNGAKVR